MAATRTPSTALEPTFPIRLASAWLLGGLALWPLMRTAALDERIAASAVAASLGAAVLLAVARTQAPLALSVAASTAWWWVVSGWTGRLTDAGRILVPALAVFIALVADGAVRRGARWGLALTPAPPAVLAVGALFHLGGWLAMRNLSPITVGAPMLAAVATGAAAGARPTRPATSSVLLIPMVATTALMARSPNVLHPTVVMAIGLVGVGLAGLRPRWWNAVERVGRPLTAVADRVFGGFGWVSSRLERPLARVFGAIGGAIAAVGVGAAWVALVLLPHLFGRISGWDPLWAPRIGDERWVRRADVDRRPGATWMAEPAPSEVVAPLRRRRVLRTAIVPTVVAVAAVGIPWWVSNAVAPSTEEPARGPRLEDTVPWIEAFGRDNGRLRAGQSVGQYAGIENPDLRSTHINIEDGWRRTWEPPTRCDARVTVWMFGGSTTFGDYQRDLHTLPSALARAAWDEGLPVRVRNGGVHGDVAWQEDLRLRRALAREPEAPDVVLFYDGYNDLIAQELAQGWGRGGPGTFVGLDDAMVLPLVSRLQLVERDGRTWYETPAPEPPQLEVDEDALVASTELQYADAHRRSREALGARSIPMFRFFQPNRDTRAAAPEGDAPPLPHHRQAFRRLRATLPPGITDLGDALDGVREPLFVDSVHTLEAANPPIAAAILDQIRPTLRHIAAAKGLDDCG